MDREKLINLAKEFLKTYGYYPKEVNFNKNAFIFSRPTGMGITDELLVYFHKKGEESLLDKNLHKLSDNFQRIPGGDNGRRFFLPNVPLGLAPEAATYYGFKYQVPAFFFDREFSTNRIKTPLKSLEDEAQKYLKERITQPYKSDNDVGDDLLNMLFKEILESSEPCLRVIIAPAGYGKTVLMSGLYRRLLDRFLDAKQAQKMGLRPLMMLPGHLKRADDLEGLINNFIGDEYDYGVASQATFKFWINNGFAIWMLDGLEELILRIPEGFIDRLLEDYIYSANSSNPQIIISIRKPLLVSSPELREALDTWQNAGIKIYELKDWGKEQRAQYFRKNLTIPKPEAESFIDTVEMNNTLKLLCNVPYYCSLMVELQNENQMSTFADDTELVEHSFDRICQREFTKGLDQEIFPIEKQKDLFSIIALENFRYGRISMNDLKDWATAELPNYLTKDILKQQLACLERHSVLSSSSTYLDFIHDIIRQFLLAYGLWQEFERMNTDYFQYGEIEPDSITFRYLAKHSQFFDWNKLTEHLWRIPSSPQEDSREFRNILNICLATPSEEKLRMIKPLLAKRNLSGIRFYGLNLQGFEFGSSKLDSAEFKACDMRGAHFDGCHFRDTFISDDCLMVGATMSGVIFESIYTSTGPVYDQKEIQRFFYSRTQRPLEEIKGPCQAAINLKRIFEKFTRKGQGFNLPRNFVLGMRCPGGVPTDSFIHAAIDNDFFVETGDHLKIKASRYIEAAQYVSGFKVTHDIRKILNSTCRDSSIGCKHVFS